MNSFVICKLCTLIPFFAALAVNWYLQLHVRTLQFVNFVLITDNNNTVEYVKTGEAHEAFFCNEATQGHCVKLDKVRFVSLRQRRRALQFREFFNHRKNFGIIKKWLVSSDAAAYMYLQMKLLGHSRDSSQICLFRKIRTICTIVHTYRRNVAIFVN